MKKKWIACCSQTGSEILNISRAKGNFPDILLTNNSFDKLNPSINDLLNNNLYKLHINGELFLVSLWHNESYFDGSGCEIIVICEPELPENILIDEDNNVIIERIIDMNKDIRNMILNDYFICVHLGNQEFKIPISNLYMKKEQTYRIKNAGLSKIKKDIYDISEKTDIIVNITFC